MPQIAFCGGFPGALSSLLPAGDAEHGEADQARGAGEAGSDCVHQQDRQTHPGAETAPHRRLLQTQTHCR